jgi:hypothetical protein
MISRERKTPIEKIAEEPPVKEAEVSVKDAINDAVQDLDRLWALGTGFLFESRG